MAQIWSGCVYSFDSTPSLETSICRGGGPKKTKKKKKVKIIATTFLSVKHLGAFYPSPIIILQGKHPHFQGKETKI